MTARMVVPVADGKVEHRNLPDQFPDDCYVDNNAVRCGQPATHALFIRCQRGHNGLVPACLHHGKTAEAKSVSGVEVLRCLAPGDCPMIAVARLYEVVR